MTAQEFLIKYRVIYRTIVISLLTSILGYLVINGGKFLNEMEQRSFTSVDNRVNAEKFFQQLSEGGNLKLWFDHVTNPGVHMPKEAKDSIYVTREELKELIKTSALDNYESLLRFRNHEIRQERVNKEMQSDLKLILQKLEHLEDSHVKDQP